MRYRLLTALAVGLLSALVRFALYPHGNEGALGDIFWGIYAARDLWHGLDPYRHPASIMMIPYPLPAAFIGALFAGVPTVVGGPLFVGCCSALLAFGVTRDNQWWRLMLFCSAPYLMAVKTAQWSPLFLAMLYLPWLIPLVVVKPTLALPVALRRLGWNHVAVCAVILAISLIIHPSWPWKWFHQTRSFGGFVPLLTAPGMLLLLALLNWRSERSQFFLALASVPQQILFYDQLLLWCLPENRYQMLFLTFSSWLGLFASFTIGQTSPVIVVALYIPALLIVLYPAIRAKRGIRRSAAT